MSLELPLKWHLVLRLHSSVMLYQRHESFNQHTYADKMQHKKNNLFLTGTVLGYFVVYYVSDR